MEMRTQMAHSKPTRSIIEMWGASDLSLLDLNMDYIYKLLDDIVPSVMVNCICQID